MITDGTLDRLKRLYSVVPILLLGEPGVGKTHTARALWEANGRPGRFIHLNCAAVAPDLVDSELFGHVRGAFTGAASSRQGLVRAAGVGCLFLDEVAELPMATQGRLLRLLSERELRAVGADTSEAVRCSIIAATNRDVRGMTKRGEFRADLLARFGEVTTIAPLRERRDDMREHIAELAPAMGDEARELVMRQDWRGTNIRGLRLFLRKCARLGAVTPARVMAELSRLPGVTHQGDYDPRVLERARRLTLDHGDAGGWWKLSELAEDLGQSPSWTRKRVKDLPGLETEGKGPGTLYRVETH